MSDTGSDEFYDPREEETGNVAQEERPTRPNRGRHHNGLIDDRPPIRGNVPPHYQRYQPPLGGWQHHHGFPPHPLANFDVGTGVVLQGEDGLSAYEIAVKNGFEGTEKEWLESLKGADGFPRTLKADLTIYGDEARVTVEEKEDNVVVFHFVLPENYVASDSGGTGGTGLGMGLGMGLGSAYNGGGD